MHGRFKIMRLGQNLGAVAVRRRPGGIWDPGSPSATTGGVVRIWDPATGTPLRELTGRTNKVNLLGFSSDGQLLAPRQGDTQSRFPSSGVI